MPDDAQQPLLNGQQQEQAADQISHDVRPCLLSQLMPYLQHCVLLLLSGSEASSGMQVNEVVIGDGADAGGAFPADGEQVDEARITPHEHYSDRAPWLRAAVLGANDGLVSVSAIMLGVGAGNVDLHTLVLSGLSALVAGVQCTGFCVSYAQLLWHS